MVRQSSSNPARNALPPGLNETELIRGIEVSGYPLQLTRATRGALIGAVLGGGATLTVTTATMVGR